MTQFEAETRRNEIMIVANGLAAAIQDPAGIPFGLFVEHVFLPAKDWKPSTAATSTDRIRRHLVAHFAERPIGSITRKDLQDLLNRKHKTGLGKSMLDHLRFDLRDIFRFAQAEGNVTRDPSTALTTPRKARGKAERPLLTAEHLRRIEDALPLREVLMVRLGVVEGLRPGEALALRWSCVLPGELRIEERFYRGQLDTPKNKRSAGAAALSERTESLLRLYRKECPDQRPMAFLFASENPLRPMALENYWRRHVHPALQAIGLAWVQSYDFRRANATLGHAAGADPKVMADQRRHGLGVSLDTYTRTPIDRRRTEIQKIDLLNPRNERRSA